jgi:hypothetical protein
MGKIVNFSAHFDKKRDNGYENLASNSEEGTRLVTGDETGLVI